MITQYQNSAARWVAAPRPQKATRWKARVYVRGHDGVRQEIVRFGRTRREAEASLDTAAAAVLRGADAVINPTMPLLEAGEYWLKQITRPDSGLSARTIDSSALDYDELERWTRVGYERGTRSRHGER
jgi:hypothetical protein